MTRHPDTLADIVDRLTRNGFTEEFSPGDGAFVTASGARYAPDDLEVVEVHRFEGLTNPDDESVVFALRCPRTGLRGTFVSAFGPESTAEAADLIQALATR